MANKGKAPAHSRYIQDDDEDDAREQQTRNAQSALAKGKHRLVPDEDFEDEIGDEDLDDPPEEVEDIDEATYWPPDDPEELEPDPVQEDDVRVLRATTDAQAEEIRQLRAAAEQSRIEYENMMRRLDRMTSATPGASSSGSSAHGPVTPRPANNRVANTSRPASNPRPANALRPANTARPADAPRPAQARPDNPPRPVNPPRPAITARPSNAPRPAPSEDSHPGNIGDLPPIVGVNAPRWIPYPLKDTDRTMARIRYGLGAEKRETWLNMQDAARQVAGLCGFDFQKNWRRQNGDHITLGGSILERRVPGLLNFEDRWATTRLLQTKFNHRRGHRLQTEREAREQALAADLAFDEADLDNPGLMRLDSIKPPDAAMDLDDIKPAQPLPRRTQPVATGSHATMPPAAHAPSTAKSQLKRRREESPPPRGNPAFHPDDPLSIPSFPQSKRSRKLEPPPSPELEAELELELDPEPEPEPVLEPKPKPKPKAASKAKANGQATASAAKPGPTPPKSVAKRATKAPAPAAVANSVTGPNRAPAKRNTRAGTSRQPQVEAAAPLVHPDPVPARKRKAAVQPDQPVNDPATKSNGSADEQVAPDPPRNRSIRPKMRPPPPPSPPPLDTVGPNPDLPVSAPVPEPPTRRQGLRSSNAALAAMNRTAAALQASASSARPLTSKGRKSAKRAPSEPLTEPLTEPPSEPLQLEPLRDARESDDGFHEEEGDDEGDDV